MPSTGSIDGHAVVSREEWLSARQALLEREKAFTRERDKLSRERRELPWVEITKEYSFAGDDGLRTLAELFDGRSQLLVYHFMHGPEWEEGCVSCSFWADNFDGIDVHLAHRDTSFVAISRAPLDRIASYKKRMGWSFPWLSSHDTDFNVDMGASFLSGEVPDDAKNYNFGTMRFGGEEAPGVSVFYRDDSDRVFLTYQTFSRGLDMLNGAYHYLDLTPKGRDEGELSWPMEWLSRHDAYAD